MKWTATDQKHAMLQGWLLSEVGFVGEKTVMIQRLDSPYNAMLEAGIARKRIQDRPRFQTDAAAAGYVVGRADAGDKLATKALACVGSAYRTVGWIENFGLLVA